MIRSCRECHFFQSQTKESSAAWPLTLYAYFCTHGWREPKSVVRRQITLADGVNPPPTWCPLRSTAVEVAR